MNAKIAWLVGACVAFTGSAVAVTADQSTLTPVLNSGETVLRFDWPTIEVGTGEYEEGPTGLTVIRFARRVHGAVDVRGGGPGTVNTDYLRVGYDVPELDAVVFSGGSFYGLEATTAVNTAAKDDGLRDGYWNNIGFTVGAIIYDFGDRRLNEIYPDKRLAQAAYRAARPGVFPLGPHGAGRMAKTGGLFGCNAHSGQGAAFRQIGDLKIAAFVVVNALGVVTKRDGRVAACYPDVAWPKDLHSVDLMTAYPASRKPGWHGGTDGKRNTTISLVVTNQKLTHADLQRLATQVHSSMARAIQPFATEFDGDVLYAVSTAELDRPVNESDTPNIDLDVIADDVMWDAILSSVPEQPTLPSATTPIALKNQDISKYAGDYVFSPQVTVRVTVEGSKLMAQTLGKRPAFAIKIESPVELTPISRTDFIVQNRYPLTLSFAKGKTLLINAGHWQQIGRKP
jgi:L-aminopeptidase/D-esterase-like protein